MQFLAVPPASLLPLQHHQELLPILISVSKPHRKVFLTPQRIPLQRKNLKRLFFPIPSGLYLMHSDSRLVIVGLLPISSSFHGWLKAANFGFQPLLTAPFVLSNLNPSQTALHFKPGFSVTGTIWPSMSGQCRSC